MTPEDAALLERTLVLAERGRRTASPNPVVGCVIVRDGEVIGEGWHERPGGPHAERAALDACRVDPAGATTYVSLEPCSHQGRQPPCADALIAAGIARVVAAAGDPSAKVDGQGFARLRAAGIAVELASGELERRARRQNAPFRVHAVDGRPFVLLKLAASLDGRTAASSGESRWISSAESRRLVHGWRASFDAVAVGSGTALADDPLLAPRDAEPPAERMPLRLVFDRRARLAEGAALGRSARAGEGEVLRVAPATAAPPPAGIGRLDADGPAAALRALGERRVTSLLVEGGAQLGAALVDAGLVDAIALFAAPLLLGAGGPGVLGALGAVRLADAPRLHDLRARPIGPDVLVEAELRQLP